MAAALAFPSLALLLAVAAYALQFVSIRDYSSSLLFHGERYHGHHTSSRFFEGWYFKLVSATQPRDTIAIVPGIYKQGPNGSPKSTSTDPDTQDGDHAFVFVAINGEQVFYYRYDVEQFSAATDRFEVWIGASRFSTNQVIVDLKSADATDGSAPNITGLLKFDRAQPWPASMLSPGAMGFFAWLPLLECYHEVVSFHHQIEGSLRVVDGKVDKTIDFEQGSGYVEKDWGTNFPRRWTWMQTNHLSGYPGDSLMISIADVPLYGYTIQGLLIGLWHEGELYKFCTYNGASLQEYSVEAHRIRVRVRSFTHELTVDVDRSDAPTMVLPGPTTNGMQKYVHESFSARATVQLSEFDMWRNPHKVLEAEADSVALETVGWE